MHQDYYVPGILGALAKKNYKKCLKKSCFSLQVCYYVPGILCQEFWALGILCARNFGRLSKKKLQKMFEKKLFFTACLQSLIF